MSKSKVFVGPINTAGNAKYIANALKEAGIFAKSFSFKEHPFGYKTENDNILFQHEGKRTLLCKFIINKYSLRIIHFLQRLTLFFRCLLQYNTFIFISPETFFKSHIDLPILKISGKKISFFFPGCTERDPFDIINKKDNAICSICDDYGLQRYCLCHNREKKKKKIRYFEKYSDYIFARRNTISFLKEKKYFQIYLSTNLNVNFAILDKYNSKKIKIVHFPSHKKLKVTKIILEILYDLEKQYSDKIEIVSERISNDELLNELKSTHILIDHLTGGGYGLLAVEAMASGCVVVAKLSDWFVEDYSDMPILSSSKEEMKTLLETLIKDKEKIREIGKRGIEYYHKHHSLLAVGQYYKEKLNL